MAKAVPGICLMVLAFVVPSAALAGSGFNLADGTPVRLRLNETVSSATAQVNDNVSFQVVEAIEVNGVVVVPKGATAVGTVTTARPKRRMARGGKLDITIDSVRLADGEKAALRAVKNVKGGGHTGAMTAGIVATSLIVWPAAPFFLFMHGKDVTIPEGTEITAFVNGDMDLNPEKFSSGAPGKIETGSPTVGAQQTLASLAVTSTPGGADIVVDGKYVGSTPSKLELTPGSHTILIQQGGYAPWHRTITVAPGDQITVNATLEEKPPAGVQ